MVRLFFIFIVSSCMRNIFTSFVLFVKMTIADMFRRQETVDISLIVESMINGVL